MAKLASQNIVVQLSKAVSDDEPDSVKVLNEETVSNIKEVVSELIDDNSVVVEVYTAE